MNAHLKLRSAIDTSKGVIHLNNAGLCPSARPAVKAVSDFMAHYAANGYGALEALIGGYEGSRVTLSKLVGCKPDMLAHLPTCSAAISQVAFGFSFKKGDEILLWDQEYPSNAYPWHSAARRSGAVVRLIKSGPDHTVDTAKLLEAIGPKTRVVAISWVQSMTGAMTDLKAVAAACQKYDAWLVVDVIQGLGIIPFDMDSLGVDAVSCGTQKWLCSLPGHGFLALKEGRQKELEPLMQGAFTYGMAYDPVDPAKPPRADARRFEPGCPLILGALATAGGAQTLMDAGIRDLNVHANKLSLQLKKGLEARGAHVLSRTGEPGLSPIVTFRPSREMARMERTFMHHKITHVVRGGNIRLSPHGFNTEAEISAVLAAMDLTDAEIDRLPAGTPAKV